MSYIFSILYKGMTRLLPTVGSNHRSLHYVKISSSRFDMNKKVTKVDVSLISSHRFVNNWVEFPCGVFICVYIFAVELL